MAVLELDQDGLGESRLRAERCVVVLSREKINGEIVRIKRF